MKTIAGLFSGARDRVFGPKVVKTVDPRYPQAKKDFQELCSERNAILGSLLQLQKRVTVVAAFSTTFGRNLQDYFADCPGAPQVEADTFLSGAQRFEELTASQFSAPIEPEVISPLRDWDAELRRLEGVLSRLRTARRKLDRARTAVERLQQHGKAQEAIVAEEQKLRVHRAEYEEALENFVASVGSLVERKHAMLTTTSTNLIRIMSEYIAQVAAAIQPMKSVFPYRTPRPDAAPADEAQEAAEAPEVPVEADGVVAPEHAADPE
jgi:prefoldin subunit 5